MTSRDEINSLINQYSFTLDSGDLEAFVGLFSKAIWVFGGGRPNVGSKELMENVVSRVILYEDGTPRTRHVSSNIEITIDDDDQKASCQRYVIVYQQTEALPLQVIYSGHYFDEFVKENGSWRFSKCEIERPLFGNLNFHMK